MMPLNRVLQYAVDPNIREQNDLGEGTFVPHTAGLLD